MGNPLQKVDNIIPYAIQAELYGLVGSYVSAYKASNGVSDGDVARAVGCSRQAIQALRVGKGTFSGSLFLCRVAGVFGLSLVELLDEARKLPPSPAPAR